MCKHEQESRRSIILGDTMKEKILLDITFEVFPGATADAPRKFCITFIFPKMSSQVKFWLTSRITAKEFFYELTQFMESAFSKLFMND